MKQVVIAVSLGVLISSSCYAADRYIEMSTNPDQALISKIVDSIQHSQINILEESNNCNQKNRKNVEIVTF